MLLKNNNNNKEIIYFFNFCPNCTRTRGFSRHTFLAHFESFLFWYFQRFLLFSLLLHENEGLHCLCYSTGIYNVLWSSDHSVQKNCQIVEEV